MSERVNFGRPAEVLRPSWRRLGFAALVATVGALMPQHVPLEWYPLNNPGTDILYLELTCASDKNGEVQVFYNTTDGIQELESIRWPISPTTQTYTYTFPLPDAPIVELRLDPISDGGTLNIRQMRIINRRGEEIRRFTREMFLPQNQMASILPTPDGWSLTSTPGANDPFVRIELFSPILPPGMNTRNLERCLLSAGYLAGMLWILLLAVLFAVYRPTRWRELPSRLAFMAAISVMFAVVGNRGLIRNSIVYARYHAPALASPEMHLELDLRATQPETAAQLFWDTGNGIREADSYRSAYLRNSNLQTIGFPLPRHAIKALRFDPQDSEGTVLIRGIRVLDAGMRTVAVLPLDSLQAAQQIDYLKVESGVLRVVTTPGAKDPILQFAPSAVASVNRALDPHRPATH